MREHFPLPERIVHEAALNEFEAVAVVAVEFHAEMAAQEPLLEQSRIALQQRLAESADPVRWRDRLQLEQLPDGRIDMEIGVVVVDDLRQGGSAEVLQQQESRFDILCKHARHAHAAGLEQGAHAQPWPHVFLIGR